MYHLSNPAICFQIHLCTLTIYTDKHLEIYALVWL